MCLEHIIFAPVLLGFSNQAHPYIHALCAGSVMFVSNALSCVFMFMMPFSVTGSVQGQSEV